MKFDLYRHPDGSITSIVCNDTDNGQIALENDRKKMYPRIQRTDSNGKILLRDDGTERKTYIAVSDFLVLLYLSSKEEVTGCTDLKRDVISFCKGKSFVDTSGNNPAWGEIQKEIGKFNFNNKFFGRNATIINACRRIGDSEGNMLPPWLRKVNSDISLYCNCKDKDAAFRLPAYKSLLAFQTRMTIELKETYAERYICVPGKDGVFRSSSLLSLTELLEGGDQFVLKGKALTGKTTALKLVTKTLGQHNSPFLPVYIDLTKTAFQEDYPIKRFVERVDPISGNNKSDEKKIVLIIDNDSSDELPDALKKELQAWRENGVKIITTCSTNDSVDCYLTPLTDNSLAEYLNFPQIINLHLPPFSPLRELPILHLYKTLLASTGIAASAEVSKWDVLNSYFSPAFSGSSLPAVGFYSECLDGSSLENALTAVSWYINRTGNEEQKRALQGKYLFQWGAVEFILQIIKSGELCIDDTGFNYTKCSAWGELLYESLKDTSTADILRNSYDNDETYHQFVLKCLYVAYYSYIDSLRNEDKAKVKRCEEIKDSLYRVFMLEYEYVKSGKTDSLTIFLRIARLCGEVFRRCFQFDKVELVSEMVYSLFSDKAEEKEYKLLLLSIDNNKAKSKRAEAVMMYEQQESLGNKTLKGSKSSHGV